MINTELEILKIESAAANHWFEGIHKKLFENNLITISGNRGFFLWVIVSDEQKLALRKRPLRKAFKTLNEQLTTELREPLEALNLGGPRISLVRQSRQESLYRWAEARNLTPF